MAEASHDEPIVETARSRLIDNLAVRRPIHSAHPIEIAVRGADLAGFPCAIRFAHPNAGGLPRLHGDQALATLREAHAGVVVQIVRDAPRCSCRIRQTPDLAHLRGVLAGSPGRWRANHPRPEARRPARWQTSRRWTESWQARIRFSYTYCRIMKVG